MRTSSWSVRVFRPRLSPDRATVPFLPLSSTKNGGLGIGLLLCRSLIEAHGGRIWGDANTPGATMHFAFLSPPFALSRLSCHD